MSNTVWQKAVDIEKKHDRAKVWKKAVTCLGAVVVFCTTYALILPAITAEQNVFCGIEEHVHDDKCYEKVLSCVLDAEAVQVSSEGPGDVESTELAAFVAGEPAAASDSAVSAHVHAAECYTQEQVAVCGFEETPGHQHTDSCISYVEGLICVLEENPGHVHSPECVVSEDVLICDNAEEGHEHTPECYESRERYVCGLVDGEGAHTHGSDCYVVQKTLTCENADPAHVHDDTCFSPVINYVCGITEGQGAHTHSEACFTTEDKLVCTELTQEDIDAAEAAEARMRAEHVHSDECYSKILKCEKIEHSHELMCYSNLEADLESPETWEASVSHVQLSGNWREDVIAVAKSQLGYHESVDNFKVDDYGDKLGYSRYGAWYGDSYGKWCAMFVSFCLNYADVEQFPLDSNCANWIDALKQLDYQRSSAAETYNTLLAKSAEAAAVSEVNAETLSAEETVSEAVPLDYTPVKPVVIYHDAQIESDYMPAAGDIVFFSNGGERPDHVGFVTELTEIVEETNTPRMVRTIEGNRNNDVSCGEYTFGDDCIIGYAHIPEKNELESYEAVTLSNAAAESAQTGSEATLMTETENYKVSVSFGPEACIPEGTKVVAVEFSPESDEFKAYAEKVSYELQWLIDITLFYEGIEIEPAAPVKVLVESLNGELVSDHVSHFMDDGENEQISSSVAQNGVFYVADHFSVYGGGSLATKTVNVTMTNGASVTVHVGDTIHLVPEDSTKQEDGWSSNNGNVTKVSSSTTYADFIANSVGTSTISHTYWYSKQTEKLTVNVISFYGGVVTLLAGGQETVIGADGTNHSWKVGDSRIASVSGADNTIKVDGLSAGDTTITHSYTDTNGKPMSVEYTVSVLAAPSTGIIKTIYVGDKVTLTGTKAYSDSDSGYNWTVSDPNIAYITSKNNNGSANTSLKDAEFEATAVGYVTVTHTYKSSRNSTKTETFMIEVLPRPTQPQTTPLVGEPTPAVQKYIKYNNDGTYDLTLNVTGDVKEIDNNTKFDILFIVDISNSMNRDTPSRLKQLTTALGDVIDMLDDSNVDARYNMITFSSQERDPKGWTGSTLTDNKAISTAKGWLANTTAEGGTNYDEAFKRAATVQFPRSDANHAVVFITDGVPTFWGPDANSNMGMYDRNANSGPGDNTSRLVYQNAIASAALLDESMDIDYFFGFGVGDEMVRKDSIDVIVDNFTWQYDRSQNANTTTGSTVLFSIDNAEQVLKNVADAVTVTTDRITVVADSASVASTFTKSFETFFKNSIKGGRITDTLSDMAQVTGGSARLTITVTKPDGTVLTGSGTAADGANLNIGTTQNPVDLSASYFVDEYGESRIALDFPKDYELEDGWNYAVTIQIEPTSLAYITYDLMGYSDIGEPNTDAPGNNTSSGKDGFFSNKDDEGNKALFTYVTVQNPDVDKSVEYDLPVIQVDAVYKPDAGVDPTPNIRKYIYDNKDLNNTYDLTLDVTPGLGTEDDPVKLDVLFIVDLSASMSKQDELDKNNKSATRLKAIQDGLTSFANTIQNDYPNIAPMYNLVTFNAYAYPQSGGLNYTNRTGQSLKAYTDASINDYKNSVTNGYVNTASFLSKINTLKTPSDKEALGGTNTEAGLTVGGAQVNNGARTGSRKVVIFLTDGVPTYYQGNDGIRGNGQTADDANVSASIPGALRGAAKISADNFYAIGFGEAADNTGNYTYNGKSYTARTILEDITKAVNARQKENYFRNVNNEAEKSVIKLLDTVAEEMATIVCKDVTILDTLSDYAVEAADDAKLLINVTNKEGRPVGTYMTSTQTINTAGGVVLQLPATSKNALAELNASYDPATKKLKLDFPDDYELEDGWTYSVTIGVKPTEKAYSEYSASGYNSIGDDGTDKPGLASTDWTSSGKDGFYSNKQYGAQIWYTGATGNHSLYYDMPVLQVDPIELNIEKSFSGLLDTRPYSETLAQKKAAIEAIISATFSLEVNNDADTTTGSTEIAFTKTLTVADADEISVGNSKVKAVWSDSDGDGKDDTVTYKWSDISIYPYYGWTVEEKDFDDSSYGADCTTTTTTGKSRNDTLTSSAALFVDSTDAAKAYIGEIKSDGSFDRSKGSYPGDTYEVKYNNDYEASKLIKIEKKVVGASTTQDFYFSIVLDDNTNKHNPVDFPSQPAVSAGEKTLSFVTYMYDDNGKQIVDGNNKPVIDKSVGSFSLKDGESIIIAIPKDARVTLIETAADGYYTTTRTDTKDLGNNTAKFTYDNLADPNGDGVPDVTVSNQTGPALPYTGGNDYLIMISGIVILVAAALIYGLWQGRRRGRGYA